MELFTLFMLLSIGLYIIKSKDQGKRIALLGKYLGRYQIEKMMETLTQGYARALGETEEGRQTQILNLLNTTELALGE